MWASAQNNRFLDNPYRNEWMHADAYFDTWNLKLLWNNKYLHLGFMHKITGQQDMLEPMIIKKMIFKDELWVRVEHSFEVNLNCPQFVEMDTYFLLFHIFNFFFYIL